jgi:hypothetical protein
MCAYMPTAPVRPPAPAIGLRVHVGAVREQLRRQRRVPVASGFMERRQPVADRARAETASARHRRSCVSGNGRVCAFVPARVCVCVRHACMHAYMFVGMCVSSCRNVSTHVCMCVCMYVCMHVRMYACKYVCMSVFSYVSMWAYMYA